MVGSVYYPVEFGILRSPYNVTQPDPKRDFLVGDPTGTLGFKVDGVLFENGKINTEKINGVAVNLSRASIGSFTWNLHRFEVKKIG